MLIRVADKTKCGAAGKLAVASWLWQVGCGKLAVASWLWQVGCGKLAVASWRIRHLAPQHSKLQQMMFSDDDFAPAATIGRHTEHQKPAHPPQLPGPPQPQQQPGSSQPPQQPGPARPLKLPGPS